jgi:hypothetical protein
MIFKKPIAQLFIAKCGLQILKVSGNLEILDVNVVEIPWKYPIVVSKNFPKWGKIFRLIVRK